MDKNPSANAGGTGSILGPRRFHIPRTEASYRAVALDAYDAAFGGECDEVFFQFGVFRTHYEADVHD